MQGALDLAPDAMVAGRYRLVAPLAHGGTSSVWRATDVTNDREVAIKVLRDDGVDPALRSRAEKEASILAGLSHTNLVEVLDSGDEDGRTFMVMALLDGAPLSAVIADRGKVPADEAVNLVADVADGLGVAHRQGVIHRDVKPANIVCHQDVPTLVDFGIARAIDATTLTRGLVVGTASYLAPEQAQGHVLSPATDVYALACVLYELLTGRPPFEGATSVTVAMKHVQDMPVPPGDLTHVPAAVDAVVLRALSKDPANRPGDGAAFANELRVALAAGASDETMAIAAVSSGPGTVVMAPIVAAEPSTPLAPVSPAPRQRRRPLAMVYLAIAAAVVVVVLLLSHFAGGGNLNAPSVPKVVTTLTVPTTSAPPTTAPTTAPPRRGKHGKGD